MIQNFIELICSNVHVEDVSKLGQMIWALNLAVLVLSQNLTYQMGYTSENVKEVSKSIEWNVTY